MFIKINTVKSDSGSSFSERGLNFFTMIRSNVQKLKNSDMSNLTASGITHRSNLIWCAVAIYQYLEPLQDIW